MKHFIPEIFLVILACNFGCAEQAKNNKNPKIMKTFDIKTFEKNNKRGTFSFVENDTIVNQFKDDYYREYRRTAAQKNYKKLYTYNKNGNLIGESTYFLGLLVGKVVGFDEKGNIIRETDYTRPNFKFTIHQLAEKMRKEFGLDMYNADNIELLTDTRLDKGGSPIVEWWVVVKNKNNETNEYESKTYRVDGTTGDLISIEKGVFGGIN